MALLKLDNLTIRFGGLAAVDGVSYDVESGNIQSIIGPNGAGKTTVFNAISGIYEPTSGNILFNDHDMRRPFDWRVVAGCALIGLLTGLLAVVSTVGINELWHATIKRNYYDRTQPFSYAAAWQSAGAFWRGELAVQPGYAGSWNVVDASGQKQLATVDSREAALAEAERLQTSDDPRVQAAREAAASRRRATWLALLPGLVVGASGTWVVWSRARRTPDVIARAGIARTFQNIRLFKNMTVLENVLTAMDRLQSGGIIGMAFRTPGSRRKQRAVEQTAFELLQFVGVANKANALAKNLPYGDQRRLEIARAMATNPKLILLDEPAAGMNPAESGQLTKLIEQIRQRGITVLLIEHHMKLVMGISDRIAVLDYGKKIAEGTPEQVRANPAVIKAYLGDEDIS
jgi:ABC-type branched-subunit amino acid transport system ATPase component